MKYVRSATFGSKDIGFRKAEFVAKTQFLYSKIHICASELPPMRVQYTGHMALSVSRDQYTALPLMGVLMTSYVLIKILSIISIKNKDKNYK